MLGGNRRKWCFEKVAATPGALTQHAILMARHAQGGGQVDRSALARGRRAARTRARSLSLPLVTAGAARAAGKSGFFSKKGKSQEPAPDPVSEMMEREREERAAQRVRDEAAAAEAASDRAEALREEQAAIAKRDAEDKEAGVETETDDERGSSQQMRQSCPRRLVAV